MVFAGVSAVKLIHAAKFPLQKVRDAERASTDPSATLAALDAVSYPLADIAASGNAGLHRLGSLVSEIYYGRLKRLVIDPCGERVRQDIERLRQRAGSQADGSSADDLYDVHRAYQMLGGIIAPDARLLERVLLDQRRWYAGIDAPGAPASPAAERFARQQLAFLLQHMDDTSGWPIACDRHLVEKVNFELGDALWLRQAYDDIINSLQGGFPTIRRDQFIYGPFRETLEIGGCFSAIYSQKGWDEVLKGAIEARSDELAARFRELKIGKSAREIRARLTQRFTDDFDRHWMEFLAGTTIAGLPDLAAAPARIGVIIGPQSPYREFVKEVWKAHHLQIVGPDLRIFTGDGDLTWVDGALEALSVLQKDVERYLAATEPRRRSQDLKRLQELADAVEAAWSTCTTAVQSIESQSRRNAALKGLRNVLQSIVAALSNEILAEQNAAWAERVRRPFLADLSGRFPFDASARDAVPIATFTRMFNPVSGSLWAVTATIEDLRRIKGVGRDLLPVSGAYESMLAKCQQIRSGFYPGTDRIAAPFSLALQQREGVKDVQVTCGMQSFALYDRPDFTGQFVWKEGGGMDARLSITIVTGQVLGKDFTSEPWGIFRLIRSGEPSRRPDGSYACSWRFPSQAVGAKAEFKADAVLSGTGFECALVGDLFAGFACPEGIGP
jgi:type VI protein secretion system component VasK